MSHVSFRTFSFESFGRYPPLLRSSGIVFVFILIVGVALLFLFSWLGEEKKVEGVSFFSFLLYRFHSMCLDSISCISFLLDVAFPRGFLLCLSNVRFYDCMYFFTERMGNGLLPMQDIVGVDIYIFVAGTTTQFELI